jgi:hypothetical protein
MTDPDTSLSTQRVLEERLAALEPRVRDICLRIWDPIGLGQDFPADEYDCCVLPICGMLMRKCPRQDLAEYLVKAHDHIKGTKPEAAQLEVAINALLALVP